MSSLSVVIITRNEENNIVDCIRSAKLVADDIVVVDCGSEDDTATLAEREGARVFVINWRGFGFSRNFGAAKARHNWIFALDADERISERLAASIKNLSFPVKNLLIKFSRKNYIGDKAIRFGTLGFETVTRIYNRNYCEWDLTQVHEKLNLRCAPLIKKISGHISHFGWEDLQDHKERAAAYARLSAEKYFMQGRSASLLKRIGSPLFNSFKSYFFLLGFLDGMQGFRLARTVAFYSWLKYHYLNCFHAEANKKEVVYSTRRKMETI